MTSGKLGLFLTPLSPIVTLLSNKALVLLSQNPLYPSLRRPWCHLWTALLSNNYSYLTSFSPAPALIFFQQEIEQIPTTQKHRCRSTNFRLRNFELGSLCFTPSITIQQKISIIALKIVDVVRVVDFIDDVDLIVVVDFIVVVDVDVPVRVSLTVSLNLFHDDWRFKPELGPVQ